MLITARITRPVAGSAALLLAAMTTIGTATPALAAPSQRAGASATAGRLAASGFPPGAFGQLATELRSAWQVTNGNGVLIGLISSGVDSVSGLSGKVTRGPDLMPMSGEDHTDGTVLASAIAGSGPTSLASAGQIGIAPGARILSIRVYDSSPAALGNPAWETLQSVMIKAIRYAVDHGANVIVDDTGVVDISPAMGLAVAYAISKNVPVIAMPPDSLPGVIDANGQVLDATSGGNGINLRSYPPSEYALVSEPSDPLNAYGPGDEPYSIYNSGAAITWLTGVVALMKAAYPKISPAQIRRALALSASFAPSGGYNTTVGFGLINPSGALRQAGPLMKAAPAGTAGTSPTAHLGTGSPPGPVQAVRHSAAVLGGYSGGIVVGLVLVVLGLLLRRPKRLRPAPAAAQPAPGWPPRPAGAPQFTGQGYPPQPYPGQPYPGQAYPPYPEQSVPALPYPGQPYPGHQPMPPQAFAPPPVIPAQADPSAAAPVHPAAPDPLVPAQAPGGHDTPTLALAAETVVASEPPDVASADDQREDPAGPGS